MAEDLRALRATSQTEREAAQAYMQTTTDEVRASDVRFDKVEKLLTALGSSIRGLDKKVAEIGAEVTSSKVDLQFLAQRTTALERGIGGQVEADLNLYWNALPRPQWPFSRKRWFLSIALLLSIAYSAVMAYVWAR
jgi:septal ring factor EnvC (AmiA/AmiB activator)